MKTIIKLTFLLLTLLINVTASAHDFEVDGIYYNIDGNEAIVTYKGTSSTQYSNEYTGYVDIPSTVSNAGTTYSVTTIGPEAFWGCRELTIVTVPNSVTSIGSNAFYFCTGLTNINIPNSVTGIGYRAFYYCRELTSINIPNSVTTIGGEAFRTCSNLTSITIPNSVTTIGKGAFDLTAWYDNQPDGLIYAGRVAYEYKGTMPFGTCITIKEGTVSISAAFLNCSGLTSITIPNSVTEIGGQAFWNCSGLTSVTIPNSVTKIGDSAFYGCSGLTSVTIPNSVTSIGSGLFKGCVNLTSINVANGNSNYDSRNNCNAIIETASNTLIAGCLNTVIPNSVTSIGLFAFSGCSSLTSITIPNSVTTIGNRAFEQCSELTSITIPNSVTAIDFGAFYFCTGLTNINIPNSVTSIGLDAFHGTAWYGNQSDGLIYAGRVAYKYKGTMPYGASITIKEGTVSISPCAFYGCTELTSVNIPNSVTEIGGQAFDGCSGLTSIDIPDSVTAIGNGAFYGCSGLTSVTIPNSVTKIGDSAFYGCSGLSGTITIPKNVTYIGYLAFYNVSSIEAVTCLAKTPPTWDNIEVFMPNVYKHSPLYVPLGYESAYMSDQSWGQFATIIGIEIQDEVMATGISLNQLQMTLQAGGTSQLIATVLPDTTTNKVLTWISSNPEIATVDTTGFVTAIVPGSATITATTTDGSNLSASCVVTVMEDLSNYDNYLSMSDTAAFHGETIVIPVKMTNDASIISFQTDIFLPEGLELLQEDGEYVIDPSERMTRTHSIMSNDVSNGAIRVLCYSSNYKPFTGNSGDDLFYITVKVADDAEGDYIIQLKNTLLTNTDFVDLAAPDVTAKVNVKAYLLGDANNSGTVSITDVVVTAQYVLELNPQPFVFEAADANADGNITVADVSRIAWMVLNPTLNAPLRAPALWNNGDRMSADGITLAAGETRRVSILLDNEMGYNAFQFDIKLPEGMTASNFHLTDRAGSHTFDVNTLQNGNIRALCYSPALTVINGHEGALLTFDVTAAGDVYGDILVDGIELVTADCQSVKLDAFTIGVNNASSINESITGKAIAKVEYFNLAGQRMEQPSTGVTLIVTTYTDGSRTTTKIFN